MIAESKVGDKVSGRVIAVHGTTATVELGEGIVATCPVKDVPAATAQAPAASAPADLSALTSLLSARWKGKAPAPAVGPAPLEAGQVRSFKIMRLDVETKKIELELA